ncbi:hypothetical protein ABZ738_24875 [Micromonospora sp. NPDC047793]|uniref:hypothetical protein n=1 Tax=Micromonospora sp. NPDC047793 TaxID=3154342 RepID=UPI0033D4921F
MSRGGRVSDLLPLPVAWLREIVPCVRRWHDEFDAEWGSSQAAVHADLLADTTSRGRVTDEALAS